MEWGARDESHGRWEVASRVCGRKLKLMHRSGSVANGPNNHSNFGSGGNTEHIAAHVTMGKGTVHAIAPKAGDPKVTFMDNGWYQLSGYNANSPYLEFDLPLANEESFYCFEVGTEYHLWYGEDMTEHTEEDNGGTAYTDIYIMS